MHRCAKRIRFFLLLLFIKGIALSALLVNTEKYIPHNHALKEFDAYLVSKVKRHNLNLSKHELRKIATTGHVLITAHGKKLTPKQLSTIKRNLRHYLKARFPAKYKPATKPLNMHFRLAKRAIKATLFDYLTNRMTISNPDYRNAMWHTVRGFVMHQLYQKSYFDAATGSLAVDYNDMTAIIAGTQKLLASYQKQLPAQAHHDASSTQQASSSHTRKTLTHRKKHLVTLKKAHSFVHAIIQSKGVPGTERNQVFRDIMAKVNGRSINGKIDHYDMKKLAHDEIQKHTTQLTKLVCKLCHKQIKAPNRKMYSCKHAYHKTCLYKKFGTVEFIKGLSSSKQCPVCVKK
ncbi:hypothetical protein JST56_00630 [Candidatus Dependentiae bacterium]|nr:hypothetical protein [Candidatus Dependentiae bacterium]